MFTSTRFLLLFVFVIVCSGEKRLLINDAGYMATELQALKALVSQLNSTVARLQSEVDRSRQHVAFYATLSAHHDLGQDQTIEFDQVLTNIGGQYNGATGVFTVPIDGLYHFSTTSFSASSVDLHTQVMVNTTAIGNNYGNSHGASATINVLVSAKKGDVVYVRHMHAIGSQKVHGSGYSAFSGFLIE